MPLGIERINPRRKQPNDLINFIKPLEGPDKALAQDFLERIAAICNPITRANRLAVMSLEEYECNPEFLGRNFNGGEVIQLVLKAPSGHWLPFRFVQMVMMHELAHCKQMNHSGAFWKVKNQYSNELKALWEKDYTGEGMWSRGRTLLTGQYEGTGLGSDEVLPEHLCGGTFRSSGKRKRKPKPKLSYKEQKDRRIAKKFGINGVTLGTEPEIKSDLEKRKKTTGKPRVAASNRGRELRAVAALARFDSKKEEIETGNDEATQSGSETGSDWEDDPNIKMESGEAIDINGKKLLDGAGRAMVRVCDDGETDDINVKHEMSELRELERKNGIEAPHKIEARNTVLKPQILAKKDTARSTAQKQERQMMPSISPFLKKEQRGQTTPALQSLTCPVCSVENDLGSPTCMVCANVLDPRMVKGIWRCQSDVCRGGLYINAGDYGVCGLCGGAPG